MTNTTSDEPIKYDVIVVGAGIHGSACAYKLTESLPIGSRILLVEQFDLLHHKGSSHGNSRICRFSDCDATYARMGYESIGQWKKIEKIAGRQVYFQTGGLDFGQASDPQLNNVIQAANEIGFEYEVLDANQLSERFPVLQGLPDSYKAVYQANAGIINAEHAVDMFHQLCRQSTKVICDIHTGERIINIDEQVEKGVIVTTSKTSYICKKLVLTCGAWIIDLVKRNFQLNLNLEVRRQSYYFWRINKEFSSQFQELPVYIHWGATPYDNVEPIEDRVFDWGFYGFKGEFDKQGHIKIAIHEPLPEERRCNPDQRALDLDQKREPRVPQRKIEILRSFISKMFTNGSLDHESYEEMNNNGNIVTCLYTCHPTDDYVIDKLPGSNNIIIGSPCSGHGFKNAPVVADCLVELVTEDQTSDKFLNTFGRNRFSIQRIM